MVGRRDSIEHPQVWRRFERTLKDGTLKKFKIQDVTEDLFDKAIELMTEYFLKEEPFTLASDCYKNPDNYKQILKFWRHVVLEHKLSVVCLEDDDVKSPEIVGVNFLYHIAKDYEFEEDLLEPPVLHEIVMEVESHFNVYDMYGVDEYLGACGLAVNPKYRGMNIACEILQSREPLCRAMGFKLTETIFTAVGSQIAATRAGFQLLKEIKYAYLNEKLNVKFPQQFESVKVMIKEFN